jgi:hypothetical protein
MTLDLGTQKRSAGIEDTLVNNGNGNIVVIDKTAITSFAVEYTIVRSDTRRIGTITVSGGQAATTTGFSYTDNYVENGSTGVTLTPADSGTELSLGYSCTNTGANATIRYSVINYGV